MDLPVFDLRGLRRTFYIFLLYSVIISGVAIFFKGALVSVINYANLSRVSTWMIFLILAVPSYIYSSWSKKQIKRIVAITDLDQQIEEYEAFFKKRLFYNLISLASSAVFLLITYSKTFLYVLIIQLVLSVVFYPSKKLISRELGNPDIIFA